MDQKILALLFFSREEPPQVRGMIIEANSVLKFNMENYLSELSAHALRKLLIKEVEKFIKCLDSGNVDELQLMKAHLKDIYSVLSEKERQEMAPILWGKNSTEFPEILQELNLIPPGAEKK
ncbi:MAG: hypothetical protein J0H74_34720 [Chitinophagaceae bacterium]|nr:hypothetical protein [Chitinophagaceae bacterium]